ncbi:MAG: glutamine synthetase [Pseudonocardiales bacterium]|jgi:glutamine synthetase|nr:glutamine synthetase [Pseudonocardiales bacterium]
MTGLSLDDLERAGIDTVIVAGTDMQGRFFGKRLPPRNFRRLAGSGISFCSVVYAWDFEQSPEGALLECVGPQTGWHDLLAVPDLDTLRIASWLPGTAFCIADCVDPATGELFAVAPRTILRRQIEGLAAAGLRAYAATELEFYLYRGAPEDVRKQDHRGLVPTSSAHGDFQLAAANLLEPFFRVLRGHLEASGIPVEVSQGEYGLGQWEINTEYGDVLTTADRHVLFKTIVQDVAAAHGYSATFMAKPESDQMSSSCHLHVSLQTMDGGYPFHDPHADDTVSDVLLSAVAGLLDHVDDALAWYAPTVNSYRRLAIGQVVGNRRTWAIDNRTVACRVLCGSETTNRVEFRVPGADVNPYLALAGAVASIRDGIAAGLRPGPAATGDAIGRGPGDFATTLQAAAANMRASSFAAKYFGPDVVEHYVCVADREAIAQAHVVSAEERARYMFTV